MYHINADDIVAGLKSILETDYGLTKSQIQAIQTAVMIVKNGTAVNLGKDSILLLQKLGKDYAIHDIDETASQVIYDVARKRYGRDGVDQILSVLYPDDFA